ncbi:hypothetical protein VPNG_08172 [Cytospora leucostoma]|uniref:Glutathione S-transferase n=1 Tax=Cytospora leucostoma TaxID=1230097 RepID=A0A423WID7_9PEZI|nr:hypothetical protein VPNG_08172 [Cytospora leucostoma]
MSSSQLKPIKVWGRGGANPPKVAMLLEELDLPREITHVEDVKGPEYLAVNPNGRTPAIHDPNTGLTIWESGAILQYLVERYDAGHRLSFPLGTPEAEHARQWLYFQVSGQGPYYGQAVWFKKFHHEHLPSALERYVKEVGRVTGVLEGHLGRQKEEAGAGDGDGDGSGGGPWLVGNKFSYADLAFLSWQRAIPIVFGKEVYDPDEFPLVKDWVHRMLARPAIAKALAELDEWQKSQKPPVPIRKDGGQ